MPMSRWPDATAADTEASLWRNLTCGSSPSARKYPAATAMYSGPALASRTSPMRTGSCPLAAKPTAGATAHTATSHRVSAARVRAQSAMSNTGPTRCGRQLIAAEFADAFFLFGARPASVVGVEHHRFGQVVRVHQPVQL